MKNVNADGETLVNEGGFTRGSYLLVCKWLGGLALLCLIGYPAVKALNKPWQAASVGEIRTVIAESACAKKLLADWNSSAQAITHRDLKHVADLCQPVDQQSKAFN
ncbi:MULTISPECIES: hypothetical protein [unclassified Pseudomonas]|uniref:hypothetical protein n=1 Tax=unclassified Pseudomonas TaxID=196821 RepID=UPI00190E041D|nr:MULTISPECIES: hypothetical protein [unclassified Pseudomonas]MBK3468478.1 hypothetical protein [Pseudomonas sp. MF6776]